MKTILTLALLAVVCTSCNYSPLEPSASGDDVAIVSLAPASGPVGTRVLANGSGFSATGNTVTFAAVAVTGETPNEPTVMPDLQSANGMAITFDILALWRPACSYGPAPCPFARIPTAPGTYRVTVTNAKGTSNAMLFIVTPRE